MIARSFAAVQPRAACEGHSKRRLRARTCGRHAPEDPHQGSALVSQKRQSPDRNFAAAAAPWDCGWPPLHRGGSGIRRPPTPRSQAARKEDRGIMREGPDPSGIPGKPPRRSRPRSARSKLAPAQMIPNLFDPGPDGDMGQTRQDGSLLPEADSSSARESGLVFRTIEPSPSSPGSNPAAVNRQATTVNLENALKGDKQHPTSALVTRAPRHVNFFATRCLNLFEGGVSDTAMRRIVSGGPEALLEMLDQDRPQRYLVPYLLGRRTAKVR